MRDPKERLRDMHEAIAAIERYLERGRAAFDKDELLQGWFVRNLQILGEAARALPEDVRALAPDIAWPGIIGMRNVLVTDTSTSMPTWSGARPAGTPWRSSPHRAALATTGERRHESGRGYAVQQAEAAKLDAAIAGNLRGLGYGR